MESLFVGQHEHSLDAKGRIVLPAAFRGAFEPSGFLIKHSEGCLALMTPDRFGEIAGQMSERSEAGGPPARAAKRSFGAGAARVMPDKQGRIAVPEELRRFAGLRRDCVVIGVIDQVEIWDAERWQDMNAQGESLLEAPERSLVVPAPT
ncbi:division/cell wall cluster transcriptional repressor MraZ [Candidatus Poriferisodalis sp.]|uniref:division/cell wall cluster transcriptional repressor MraZ n=1 Tax=Candidatus Poriferisodalis sp. TaxID=3101277 RepID=UPI003B0174A8